MNPTTVTSTWRDVIEKGNDNYYLMGTSSHSSTPAGGVIAGGTHAEAFGTAALATGTFTYLAATYDGATVKLYAGTTSANLTLVGSKAATGAIVTSTSPLQIGGDSIYGQFFSGVIDEVRVYNTALTQTQIQTDMTTPIGSGGASDTQVPTWPPSSTITATAVSSSQINLAWSAAVDNVGVTSYRIERCQGAGCSNFVQIGTLNGNPPATTYPDSGLTANTPYSYRVRATDAVPNLSAYSNTASATTLSTSDTQVPTWPPSSTITATAVSSSQINLAWSAAVDNVGVTSYRIERCQGAGCSNFVQIGTLNGTPPATTYPDSGLTANTPYSYRVRATDAVPNLSAYSNTASATTQAGGATPTGLVAAYGFGEGSGTVVTDASGNTNTGSLVGRLQWTTAGKYGGALSFNGTSSRVDIPNSSSLQLSHRDDPRGVGEPHDRLEHLARRDREGQRQLLPDGDLLPLLHPCGRGDHRRDPRGGLRHRRARDRNLHASGGHLRRGDGQALRGRHTSWDPRRPPVPS